MINIPLMKDSLGFVLSGLPYTLGISLLSFFYGSVFRFRPSPSGKVTSAVDSLSC